MLADALTREEILYTLGEFRSAIGERRIEGALTLLAPDADVTIIGSAAGELSRGPTEIRAFLETLFADERRFGWEWDDVSVSACGDVAWLWTEGALTIDGRSEHPYRISAVLERREGRWLFCLFHGSEPH